MEYLPLLLPLAGVLAVATLKPGWATALSAALLVAILEVPAVALLSGAGGLECPRGCSAGQDFLQGLVFLGLPGLVLVLLFWALAAALRGRRGDPASGV